MGTLAFGYPTKKAALDRFTQQMNVHAAHHGEPPYLEEEMALVKLSTEVEIIEWAFKGAGVGTVVGYIIDMKGVYFPSVGINEVFGSPYGEGVIQIML